MSTGPVALVTGAASGIGRALAVELLRRGARVVAADRDEAGLAGLDGAIPRRLDVTDAGAVAGLARETVERWGRIDQLLHFAGVALWAEARDTTREDWRRVVEVDLLGTVHVVQAVYPGMAERGAGQIVLAGSLAGLGPSPGMAAYAAAKHGVVGLGISLRAEAAGLGVRVSVACPGPVATSILARSPVRRFDRASLDERMGRAAVSPERCARAVLAGAARDRAIIVPGGSSWLAWLAVRLSPVATQALTRRRIRRLREHSL